MIKAILFDFDGIIVHTEPIAILALKTILRSHGISFDVRKEMVGKSWKLFYHDYVAPLTENRVTYEALTREFDEAYKRMMQAEVKLLPGVCETLERLHDHYRLAIVSGSQRSSIEWVLNRYQLKSYFSSIISAEQYERSKPEPDSYKLALQTLGILPTECFAIEDSTAGIAAAKSAGIPVVCVTIGNYLGQDNHMADVVIETLFDLTDSVIEKISLLGDVT